MSVKDHIYTASLLTMLSDYVPGGYVTRASWIVYSDIISYQNNFDIRYGDQRSHIYIVILKTDAWMSLLDWLANKMIEKASLCVDSILSFEKFHAISFI